MKRVWVIFVGLMISVLLGGCKSKIIKPDPKQSGEIIQQTGAYQFSEQEKTDNELQTIVSVVDLVDENILEAVWPAVIGLGSVDGKLYGMAGEVTAMSMLLPSAVPGYEHWTPEDMVRLMESGKIESNIFYEGAGCYFAPLASMRLITLLLNE